MAGNPCTDGIEDANSYVPFLAQHALASLSDYENANINCGGHFVSNSSAACKAAIQKIFNQMGTRIKLLYFFKNSQIYLNFFCFSN